MDSSQRKGINFDLNTDKLKIYYSGPGSWQNGYVVVREFFEKNGFEHIQGSGYHSKDAMSEAQAMAVIYRMTKDLPWLNYCVKVCTISDVPELYDISYVFEREAREIEEKK